jgi:hypothetical protein
MELFVGFDRRCIPLRTCDSGSSPSKPPHPYARKAGLGERGMASAEGLIEKTVIWSRARRPRASAILRRRMAWDGEQPASRR